MKTADGESRLRLVELLDAQGRLAQAFVITIIDECVSSAVATLDYAEGGAGMSTVSLSLNTNLPQSIIQLHSGRRSCRCEVCMGLSRTTSCRHRHFLWDAFLSAEDESCASVTLGSNTMLCISTLNAFGATCPWLSSFPLPRVIPVETQREMLLDYLVVLAHRNQSSNAQSLLGPRGTGGGARAGFAPSCRLAPSTTSKTELKWISIAGRRACLPVWTPTLYTLSIR
ncbi:hypothetical protein C8F01DRAFT_1264364 [Mycena amicta]|nr:hypothetical protein C8F01DRAFT_1264364 [Mycena amicta]